MAKRSQTEWPLESAALAASRGCSFHPLPLFIDRDAVESCCNMKKVSTLQLVFVFSPAQIFGLVLDGVDHSFLGIRAHELLMWFS